MKLPFRISWPMTWMHFDRAFDFHPEAKPTVTIAFRAGHKGPVTRECRKKAHAAGAARVIPTPRRGIEADDAAR